MMVIFAQQELKMLFRPLQPNSLADQSLQGLVHHFAVTDNHEQMFIERAAKESERLHRE